MIDVPKTDWESIYRIALRYGIDGEKFWKMTIKEIRYHVKAYQWRQDEWGTLLAAFTSVIANPWYKQDLKPSRLYRRRDSDHVISEEERRIRFERSKAIMGPDVIPVKRQVRK